MSTQKLLKKFEKIYNETYNNTLKYIVCICGNLDNVDDIIQDTYLEVYKILKEEKEILNYQAYIITIARSKAINYINIHNKVNTISITNDVEEVTIDIDSGIDVELDFITKDNIDKIWKYIKSQNTDAAKIFYLHFIWNMTFKEISEKL